MNPVQVIAVLSLANALRLAICCPCKKFISCHQGQFIISVGTAVATIFFSQ